MPPYLVYVVFQRSCILQYSYTSNESKSSSKVNSASGLSV